MKKIYIIDENVKLCKSWSVLLSSHLQTSVRFFSSFTFVPMRVSLDVSSVMWEYFGFYHIRTVEKCAPSVILQVRHIEVRQNSVSLQRLFQFWAFVLVFIFLSLSPPIKPSLKLTKILC